MRNRNNKQNKRKVKEDKKMNKREDKKEKEKHDSGAVALHLPMGRPIIAHPSVKAST